MKTYATKQQIIDDIFSLKTIGIISLVLTVLFLFHIRLYILVMMLASYGLLIFLAISKSRNKSATETKPSNVRPWVRLFARMIDTNICLIFILILWIVFSSSLANSEIEKIALGLGIFALFVWIFIEATLLSTIGTTFGKWLLKTKVRDKNNMKLTFSIALRRSFLVWIKGLGIGLPFVNLFTRIVAYNELTKNNVTSWDRDCNVAVTHQQIGIPRIILALVLGFFDPFLLFYFLH